MSVDQDITDAERAIIENQCSRLIASYAHFVDRRRYDELAALFTADGLLDRAGNIVEGADNILAAMKNRPEAIATRHMNGLPFFEAVGRDEVRAVTYMLMYIVEGSDDGPNEVPGTAGLGEFHDIFVRTPQGWRISRRTAKSAMIVKR